MDSNLSFFNNDNISNYKNYKSKDTRGVSFLLFLIFPLANIIALFYALLIYQTPLIIKYAIAIMTMLFYIGLFFYSS